MSTVTHSPCSTAQLSTCAALLGCAAVEEVVGAAATERTSSGTAPSRTRASLVRLVAGPARQSWGEASAAGGAMVAS